MVFSVARLKVVWYQPPTVVQKHPYLGLEERLVFLHVLRITFPTWLSDKIY